MYYITNDLGRFFSGFVHDCLVWKSHHTRGIPFEKYEDAEMFLDNHRITGVGIIFIEEGK